MGSGSGQALGERHWTAAVCLSTGVHAVVLFVLASWYVATVDTSCLPRPISTRWSEHEESSPQELERVSVDAADDVAGGGAARWHAASSTPIVTPAIRLTERPGAAERLFAEFVAWRRLAQADLAERVSELWDVLIVGGVGDTSHGDGVGGATGDGRGVGFFGRTAAGQRFVYVLDCSKSMNHPYPGPAKTRFIRVKLELLKSLQQMGPEHEFFIVFFNQQPIPMPARSMQAATTGNKLRFLAWVHQVRAEGGTEPTAALRMALALKPDVVFFLTDGSFVRRVQEEIAALPTGRTVVHTFAFREDLPEQWQQANALIESGQLSEARRLLGTAKYRKLLEHRGARTLLRSFAEKTGGGFFLIP